MRVAVTTQSGAQYQFDSQLMTWKRRRPFHTEQPIIGLDADSGQLQVMPSPQVGARCIIAIIINGIFSPNNYITTTPVQRIELLEADNVYDW